MKSLLSFLLLVSLLFAQDSHHEAPGESLLEDQLMKMVLEQRQKQESIAHKLFEKQEFKEGDPESKKVSIHIYGRENPELISADTALEGFVRNLDLEKDQSLEDLLAVGFTLANLKQIVEVKRGLDFDTFIESELSDLYLRHKAVLNPTIKVSDAQIVAYFEEVLEQELEARQIWTARFLSRLPEKTRNLVWHYLTKVGPHYVSQSYNFGGQMLFVKAMRRQRQHRLGFLHWGNSEEKRSITPPDMIFSPSRCSWMNKDLLMAEKGETRWAETGELLSAQDHDNLFNNFYRIVPMKLERLGRDQDAEGCYLKPHGYSTEFRPSKNSLFEESPGIFLAEIKAQTLGFNSGRPGSLLTLEVSSWIRKPLSGVNDIYYVKYPKAKFEMSGLPFCSENPNYFPEARVGMKVLVFGHEPVDQAGSLMYLGPWRMFVEGPEETTGHPQVYKNLDKFIAETEELAARIPFKLNLKRRFY